MVATLTNDQVRDMLPKDRISPLMSIGADTTRAMTARDALAAAGALWKVEKVPLRNPLTNDVIPGFFAVTRTDNKAVVGVVEGQYKTVQNEAFFGDVADVFIKDGARVRRTSYLHRVYEEKDKEGKVTSSTPAEVGGNIYMTLTWDVAKTAISVLGDIVGRTAIIRNSHDGKTAALISYRLMQLACLNGAVVPVPGFNFDFKILHTESASARIRQAEAVLKQAPKYFQYAGKALNLLAGHKLTEVTATTLTRRLIDAENVDSPSEMTKGDGEKVDTILNRFKGEQPRGNSEALKGTAYGWYSAVLDFADYGFRTKNSAGFNTSQQRFKSSFSGAGHQLKLDAWDVLSSEYELDKTMVKIVNSN